jgi:hypothetical protein
VGVASVSVSAAFEVREATSERYLVFCPEPLHDFEVLAKAADPAFRLKPVSGIEVGACAKANANHEASIA